MEHYTPERDSFSKDRTLVKVLLAGFGCLILIVFAFVFLIGRFFLVVKAPTEIVNLHLEAINQGNYQDAYTHLSSGYRKETSLQEFTRRVEIHSSLLPYRNSSLHKVNIVNDRATVEGTLTARDGVTFPVRYELKKEEGEWKITRYEWVSGGERLRV